MASGSQPAGGTVSTAQFSEQSASSFVDLTSPAVPGELAAIEERLHLVQGLLDALARMGDVNKVLRFSKDRASALTALQHDPFKYSRTQADAILDMPVSWQTSDKTEQLRAERDRLLTRRARLHEHVTEALALHWFG